MEPNKLISSIGAVITTVTAIILFFTEYDKIKNFFFPEEAAISLPFLILVVVGVGLIIFYIVYLLYYKEKESHRRTKIELENIKGLLLDSERLRLIDFVTGIPNEQKLKLDLSNRPKELFHLILIDLDGFSQINKTQGFQKGDEVIRTIAQDLFIKMRRDEEIYKRDCKIEKEFTKRVYRKYTGGDEFIFLIKGPQYESVGFITRIQKQLNKLSTEANLLGGTYKINFHAAIVPLYPSDTYEQAYDRLQHAYIQAAEEHENLRVFWDKETEKEYLKSYRFIYESARKEFSVNKADM